MTALGAALGRSQLRRLDAIVDTGRGNAALLNDRLRNTPGLQLPGEEPGDSSAWWKYVLRLDPAFGDAATVVSRLQQCGVPAQLRYPVPLPRHPVFRSRAQGLPCPVADRLGDELISLPVNPAPVEAIEELASVVAEEMVHWTRA
jgi:perosamine synthetase